MEVTTFAEEPSDVDDGDLARAHLTGDPHAFNTLFRRYHPSLVGYLRREFRDPTLAEEVAQETLTRALKSLTTYDQSKPLWPWLRTIAYRLACTEAGRRATEVAVPEIEDRTEPREIDLVETYVLRDELQRALRSIPARHRRALIMRYVEDREPEEIARAFGINRRALEQLLFRARHNLAREYAAAQGRSWMPGLAGLPLLVRLRDTVASWQSRIAAGGDAALAVAGNVVIGLAVAGSGVAGIVTGVGAAADGDRAARVTAIGAVGAVGADRAGLTGDAGTVTLPYFVRPTADPASVTVATAPRTPPPTSGDDDEMPPAAPEASTTVKPPNNSVLGGRGVVANHPLEDRTVHEDEGEVADTKTRGETRREGEGPGPTCEITNNMLFCD